MLLEECRALRKHATSDGTERMLNRDVSVAISALELIDRELREGHGRPARERSCQFIRYVIDEGDQMALDSELRDRIIRVEDAYARSGRLDK